MLIELKFRNFLSFKNENSFLMTKVNSFKEHIDSNVIKTDKDFDLLKTSAVFGSNASGKSNLFMAMGAMNYVLFHSYSDSLKKDDERKWRDFRFKLSSETDDQPTMFEASFLLDNSIFRYGFEINNYEIVKEWLYKKNEREVHLFIRENGKFNINKESFKEGEKYKNDVNSNVLFISHLAQNNQKISKLIHKWFSGVNVISGLRENYQKFTIRLLETDSNFKKWASLALKYLEITNIEAGEHNGEVITYHNKYDSNNLLVDSISFDLKTESAGTKKLIYILGPLYDTLRLGKVLFIDELDSKLHPNLSRKLIELFHEHNHNNAQMIFSAHDATLLDKDLLRRDQIWFVEKDQFGVSSIYPLSDFNSKTVRNTSAFSKKYLSNELGASGTIDISSKLIDLLYG